MKSLCLKIPIKTKTIKKYKINYTFKDLNKNSLFFWKGLEKLELGLRLFELSCFRLFKTS